MKSWIKELTTLLSKKPITPPSEAEVLRSQLEYLNTHPVIGGMMRSSIGFTGIYSNLKIGYYSTYAGYVSRAFRTSNNHPRTALDIAVKAGEISHHKYEDLVLELSHHETRYANQALCA